MPCDNAHTYAAMCCLALIAGTYQPDSRLIMVAASAGINAGNSDVSAPTMWREQSGPARKGEAVRAHSETQDTQTKAADCQYQPREGA